MTSIDQGAQTIRAAVKTFPDKPGVYRMLSDTGDVLYVGKAKSLPKRVISYTRVEQLPNRLKRMVAETASLEIIVADSEVEALLLEIQLIKKLKPRYNILLRDDKSFPYILLTGDHDYPRIQVYRGAKKQKGTYFGPFSSKKAVDYTIIDLQKAFLLRNCTDHVFANRTRPCLQYHIKRCSAPCVGYIEKADYNASIQQAVDFLEGKSDALKEELTDKMLAASDLLAFEKAAEYRNRIKALTHILSHQYINHIDDINEGDVVALYRDPNHLVHSCVQVFFIRQGRLLGNKPYHPSHDESDSDSEIMAQFLAQFYGNKFIPAQVIVSHAPDEKDLIEEALTLQKDAKVTLHTPQRGKLRKVVEHAKMNAKQALESKLAHTKSQTKYLADLAEILEMPEAPERVEVYDNSHISGTNAIGAMVVAGPDGFEKKSYRTFNIKSEIAAGDDYAMMREVLERRFQRAVKEEGILPDLVLIDGGKGQLGVAKEVLEEAGLLDKLTLVAVAKGEDRDAGEEKLYLPDRAEAIQLPLTHPVQYFIQRLRDEAHRFAIGTHRNRRAKSQTKSVLDEIPGVGATRKKALMLHFGSAKSISGASVEELMSVNGISRHTAETIYNHFHEH